MRSKKEYLQGVDRNIYSCRYISLISNFNFIVVIAEQKFSMIYQRKLLCMFHSNINKEVLNCKTTLRKNCNIYNLLIFQISL